MTALKKPRLLFSPYKLSFTKPCLHCPSFQPRRHYSVDTGANWDHAVAMSANIALNRDEPC